MRELPTQLTTPRLVLRTWTRDDVDAFAAAVGASIDHLRPWMPWVADEPLDAGARAALVERWESERRGGGPTIYGVFRGGVVVGGCGLHPCDAAEELEIGYWVHVDHVRQGIALELSDALTTAAFTLPQIERVRIGHDRANVASGAVPARLGFTLIDTIERPAYAPAETGMSCQWAVTREVWRQRL